jgi:hypothetical protein
MTDDSDTQAYRLKDDIDAAVRSGLVLRDDATIELSPTEAEEHADVLVPVKGDQDDVVDDDQDDDDQEVDDE